jgi:putative DNA primase/helicase
MSRPSLHVPPPILSEANPPLGAAALRYARLGFRVFPLWPRSKRPRRTPGYRAATADAGRIAAWWAEDPRYNIGLVTGDGLIVLDIDPAHGGMGWWDAHRAQAPPTPTIYTGQGGYHLLWAVPSDLEIRNSAGRLARGVDVRGDGGYIVVPPSIHPNGRPYRWIPGRSLGDLLRAPLAPELIAVLRPRPPVRSGAPAVPAQIPAGMRNTTLCSLAGTMRRRNMSGAAITAAPLVENRARCAPPLDEEEVRAIVRSISRYRPAS